MPPKRGVKRQKTSSETNGHPPKKKIAPDPLREPHPFHKQAEENGIVLRKYYPHEMNNARAHGYSANEITRPIEALDAAQSETEDARAAVNVGDSVVHWFKTDLRVADNRALRQASDKAGEAGVPLIALYVISPQDFEAHLTAPVRVDFILRTLEVMRDDLASLGIPLHVESVERRWRVPERIAELMDEWDANHLFANVEYEVDELRREARLVRMLAEKGRAFEVVHDTCVVPPGQLQSGAGRQYAVYTPWYRSWVRHVHDNPNLLELSAKPEKNSPSARDRYRDLYESKVPQEVPGKTLGSDQKERLRALWPAGEHEAKDRLYRFCEERIGSYDEKRNIPSDDGTSVLSVHLASGTISPRTCIRTARDRNKTKRLDGGDSGIQAWVSEVAWRDFYKHVLVNWPYVCMNKPFKPEYANIEWSYSDSDFQAWADGRTGFPIVDAAMRQLLHVGWMHNRCRMIVASFLSKDLLIDWRMGERHFMEHLVDGDFASNNGGWGFSASVGVDPQPYFRIFNPLLQSEKFDRDGEYIRKWVPELADVKGKAIHDPYGRGAGDQAKKKGYPKPIVEHKESRERALTAYKHGLNREDM